MLAIFLIVLSHVIQTLHAPESGGGKWDYVLHLERATSDIRLLLLAILRSSGAFGNTVFFACSAWFLLDSGGVNRKKILQMLLDIWVVSVIILAAVYLLRGGDVGMKLLVRQLLPTTFSNNWYLTCYLLFYPLHPFLNEMIRGMKQKTLLRTILVMSLIILINYFNDDHIFTSFLVLWIMLYFIIGYMKLYLTEAADNIRLNLALFLAGLLGSCGMVLLTDLIALRTGALGDRLLFWNSNYSPFFILMALSLLNLARNIRFESRVINYVSGLSLLIYIIHDNQLFRVYYRPALWEWVYRNLGFDRVLVWTFALSGMIFLFGMLAAVIYRNTVQRLVCLLVDKAYPKLCVKYRRLEGKLTRERRELPEFPPFKNDKVMEEHHENKEGIHKRK